MSNHSHAHQHQPQNPLHAAEAAQDRTPSLPAMPVANKPKARTPDTEARRGRPSPEHIRARAYEISQARNGGPGNAQTDWCQAEAELSVAGTMKA